MTGQSFPSFLLRMLLFLPFIMPIPAGAAAPAQTAAQAAGSPWSFSLRSGFLHHFVTDLEEQGDFSVNRFSSRADRYMHPIRAAASP